MTLQPFQVDVTNTLVVGKICSLEVALAHLALHDDLGTLSFNMLEKLCTSHMLVLWIETNVTAKLGTLVHSVLLQLVHGLPEYDFLTIRIAFVRELTEIDAVSENLVDWLKKISWLLTMWAAHTIHLVLLLRICVFILIVLFKHLVPTMLTEKFVALLAFHW